MRPDISNFKSWKEVTLTRPYIDGTWKMMCLPPNRTATISSHPSKELMDFRSELGTKQIGTEGYVAIFVNKVGESCFLGERTPHFPEGTIIVKARLEDPVLGEAVFLSVMYKLPAGTSPESGDWQYLVYAPDAKIELKKHNLPNCQNCHNQWKSTDYVSREYLTTEQQLNLR
ncbi:MAG: cytochrome P460 family protein [Fimbriimonadaceae bacterium]